MRKNIQSIFDKLKQSEQNVFTGVTELFSPVVQGQPIKVRIEGMIMSFTVKPKAYEGWGVFKAEGQKEAQFLREASLTERRSYLDIYPKFKAIVYQQDKKPFAVIKSPIINGNIRILLAEHINQFDSVVVRWDGSNFWYDEHDANASMINAERLRESLAQPAKPEALSIDGLTPVENAAYALAYEHVRDKVKDRLDSALKRSGGKLVSYLDRGNEYTVTYKIGDNTYTSTVDEKLRVQSAGICLSGGDKNFDLQSLVNVIKEGEARHRIVIGNFANYGYDGGDDYDE